VGYYVILELNGPVMLAKSLSSFGFETGYLSRTSSIDNLQKVFSNEWIDTGLLKNGFFVTISFLKHGLLR
jgi:hypothetical protein